jgi:DNA invertase Pin-like site-specific DNA recombinase
MYNSNYIESINNTLSLLERHAAKIIKEDESVNKKINYAEFREAVQKGKKQGLVGYKPIDKPKKYKKVTNEMDTFIIELWKQGMKAGAISTRTSVPFSTVQSRIVTWQRKQKLEARNAARAAAGIAQ